MPYYLPLTILKLLEEYDMPQITDHTVNNLVALPIIQCVNTW